MAFALTPLNRNRNFLTPPKRNKDFDTLETQQGFWNRERKRKVPKKRKISPPLTVIHIKRHFPLFEIYKIACLCQSNHLLQAFLSKKSYRKLDIKLAWTNKKTIKTAFLFQNALRSYPEKGFFYAKKVTLKKQKKIPTPQPLFLSDFRAILRGWYKCTHAALIAEIWRSKTSRIYILQISIFSILYSQAKILFCFPKHFFYFVFSSIFSIL